MPLSTMTEATTSRELGSSERNQADPKAASTGTASCAVAATVALSVFSARNQIA